MHPTVRFYRRLVCTGNRIDFECNEKAEVTFFPKTHNAFFSLKRFTSAYLFQIAKNIHENIRDGFAEAAHTYHAKIAPSRARI